MIEIIEMTDKKSKILFDNEKYSGNRKVKLTDKELEKKKIFKVTFEEAKKIIFKEKDKISFIQIENENSFDKEEFVLLTFFENFAYFIKREGFLNDFQIYSQKDRYFSLETGEITVSSENGDFYSNVEYPGERMELLKYKTILPYIFSKSGVSIENENGYLSFKNNKEQYFYKENETIVLEDNKISTIELEEEIKEKKDKKEFSEKAFDIRFEIDSNYVLFRKANGKFILNSYDCAFNIDYELEKKEISSYCNDGSNEIEIFQKSIETTKKIIKNYSNDNFNEVFETFQQKIEEKFFQIEEEKRKKLEEQNFETEFKKRMAEINI